jgi:hypothetical protein
VPAFGVFPLRLALSDMLTLLCLRSLSGLTSFQSLYSIQYFLTDPSILKYFLRFTFAKIGQILLSNVEDGEKHRGFVISKPQNHEWDNCDRYRGDQPLV